MSDETAITSKMPKVVPKTHVESDSEKAPTKPSRAKWVLLGIGVLVVIGVVVSFVVRSKKADAAQEKTAKAAANRKVPVVISAAKKIDVPIVLEGLGSVTPLASVTVKSQVDGRLESVAFKEGQAVKAGELLAQIDPRPFRIALQQAQAAQQRDQAQVKNAELNLGRYEDLRKQSLVAQQQVDDQATLVAQARASVALDAAQVASAQLQLDYSRITSPVDGVVGIRQIDPGNLVRAADTTGLVLVTQLDPISVVFTLPQDDLVRVAKANTGTPLRVEAYDRDGEKKLATGILTVIDNQVSATTATIKLKAQFDNHDHALWPSLFVKARLLVETRKDALVAPAVAVQRGQKGTYVYVVTDENKAEMRPVTVDTIEGTDALITKGLEAGDKVVIDGQSQLKPDAMVDAREDGKPRKEAPPADGSPKKPDGDATTQSQPKTDSPNAPGGSRKREANADEPKKTDVQPAPGSGKKHEAGAP